MNKAKGKQWALALSVGLLLAAGLRLKQEWQEKHLAQVKAQIRAYFASRGPVAVLYINDFSASLTHLTGGVVLADQRVFLFSYDHGQITEQEKEECKYQPLMKH
ncbi:DUF4651 domain-containing protein [Streptococcus halichoeri]|uniref:DUF4651 domain-containing protein n=1 Tax=Streptococcus halichoeri TaxID=254785 RepID=UPI00135CBB4E|nr:DUF4651 domain-containing protein [Streptococcus halichoeri]